MKDVTLLVKTFERSDCLRRLLNSIRKFYSDVPVIVADDSWVPYARRLRRKHVRSITLEPNVGLSAGRNAMVKAARTKYVVILDDDFVFLAATKLEVLRATLEANEADICAGAVRIGKEVKHYEGDLVVHDDRLHLCRRAIGSPCQVDITFNFFLARRQALLDCPWNPEYKMAEHAPFFWAAKQAGLRVWYDPTVVVDHRQVGNKSYNAQRTAHLSTYEDLFTQQFPRGIWMRENGFDAQAHNRSSKNALVREFTGICTTVMRFGALTRMVESWLKWYPVSPLIIVDQSEEHYTRRMKFPGPTRAIEAPFDIGGCQGYQAALEAVETPLYTLLEDDFVLSDKTDLPLLALMVRDTPYSLVGGALYRDRTDLQGYRGNFVWIAKDHLHVEPVPYDDPRAIAQYDLIPNFYVADTEDVRTMGGWDCSRKNCDHLGFYLRMKRAGFRVGYFPAVSINHMKALARKDADSGYSRLRKYRQGGYRQQFLKKEGLRLVTGCEKMELEG